MAERSVTAYNRQRAPITVRTFCRRLGSPGERRYVLGGYIASSDAPASGRYQGSATVQALFQ